MLFPNDAAAGESGIQGRRSPVWSALLRALAVGEPGLGLERQLFLISRSMAVQYLAHDIN